MDGFGLAQNDPGRIALSAGTALIAGIKGQFVSVATPSQRAPEVQPEPFGFKML